MSALIGLEASRLLVVAALVLVPVLMQSILRWYELRCRDRRDLRVVEMLERQQAALLSITADVTCNQALRDSAVSLQALTSATRDLTQILVASPRVDREIATPTKMGSSRGGRNDE
jgi:phosphoribosyl-dephospho-CoA transferase